MLEIGNSVDKANKHYQGRLRKNVISHHNIQLSTKVKIPGSVVLTPLQYGSKTQTLYKRHTKKMEELHQHRLWSSTRIGWQERVTNTEVPERAATRSTEALS